MQTIILASQSPRRRELFSLITPQFECAVSEIDERAVQASDAKALCETLARRKAASVAALRPGCVVVGSDTVVEADGRVLGKPHDPAEAREMLQLLSGRTHAVHTGVCIAKDARLRSFVCTTEVTFFPIPPAEIEAYIATDEPYDKAGGYGIQGRAARWTDSIRGDYFNVMGLPVSRVYAALREENFV